MPEVWMFGRLNQGPDISALGRNHRIWRHVGQVKLLARDIAKAARHLVVEERPVGIETNQYGRDKR